MATYPADPNRFFSEYIALTGVGRIDQPLQAEPGLAGKRLGLINAAAWITLWTSYFGQLYLPGVRLVNIASDAVQLNFTRAFAANEPCPPQSNIDAFVHYARDLVDLAQVDAILITCSTMNRSYPQVARAVNVPVMQIDMPMMEEAVLGGGKVLVIATLATTVESTLALLRETAQRLGKLTDCAGITVQEAWHLLSEGNVREHNKVLAATIRRASARERIACVVLAQLSMTLFALDYPDPIREFGIPVLTSGQTGFQRMRQILIAL